MTDVVYEGSSAHSQETFGKASQDDESPNRAAEDWGIEDDDFEPELTNSHKYVTRVHSMKAVIEKPLLLDPSRSLTRKIQMNQFIRAVLSQKVTPEETSRFLDQFRYMIIGSALLQRHPVYNKWSQPADTRRKDLLFDLRKPWVHLFTTPICNVAANGGLVALGLALHSKFRTASSKSEKAAVCVAIAMVLLVYSFATSKRRLLRTLREKALAYMETFINSSKALDGDLVRVLCEIQCVDIVGSGFVSPFGQPSSSAAHNGTVQYNMSSTIGACKQLKAVTSSSLLLIKEALLDAIRDVLGMCPSTQNLEQFFEIYDVTTDIHELGLQLEPDLVEFVDDTTSSINLVGAAACFCSVKQLKNELKKVHLLRKVFMCCLLTLKSNGHSDVEELERWTIVSDQLLELSKLMQQLSKMVTMDRLMPINQERHQKQTNATRGVDVSLINEISSNAKTITARIEIIRDSDATEATINEHISAIEDELTELGSKWATYSSQRASNVHGTQNESKIPPEKNTTASPTLIMTPNDNACEFEFGAECAPPDLIPTGYPDSTYSYQTTSFEGETSPHVFAKSRLSRVERIQMMKNEREMSREAAAVLSQRTTLAHELDTALRERENSLQWI